MKFHVLGIPHTASNKAHVACAYTQKVVKLCAMLTRRGHEVIHYGHADSEIEGRNIPVTDAAVLKAAYGDDEWRRSTYKFSMSDSCYREFYANAISAVHRTKNPGDYLLCMWGAGHKPVADAHPDLIAVEPGIGYSGGYFARYKVFESYALMHCYYGLAPVAKSDMVGWYDWVIPNYFDPADFEPSAEKGDYLLFLGRVTSAKGIHIAIQVAREVGIRLVVAGQQAGYDLPDDVEYVGFADFDTRRRLMAQARAVLAPSMFIEPFCGVQIEAMLSGTPVISTDWGAFTECNLHGLTGYRCRTFEQFVWAVRNIDTIDPAICRRWAVQNYSMARIGSMYEEFFTAVSDIHGKNGWYEPRPGRTELDWMTRSYPAPGNHSGAGQ